MTISSFKPGMHANGSSSEALAAGQDPLEGQFEVIRDLLYSIAGIRLTEAKRDLVRARLTRRLRKLGGGSVTGYVEFVQTPQGRSELTEMVDILTTNKTSFFREANHFDFLQRVLSERPASAGPPTIWSAGCSSGEEPYTLAMVLSHHGRLRRGSAGRILATDISDRVLAHAREGVYDREQVEPVPEDMRKVYLRKAKDPDQVEVSPALKEMIRFGRLNLMGDWPMSGPFDAIFCRNVMIYFDNPTRETLAQRFTELLTPGGYLFVGHSESLTSLKHGLRYVQPAVYRR
ncbi:MAG: protein-glutamate O-methyltransferase [Gemmatimonadota bacterium]|nr:protein-glutamate O-methyltransferase [Gemmatimonadota bacterium]MDH5759998.1 protein-glutamate O-methyltransferase [Gemmatimonadota bacterium]